MAGMVELKSNLVVERPGDCEWMVRRDEKTFEVDLTPIHRAEARREELMCAYGDSLIELANAFDDGYDAACKLHSKVIYEEEMTTIASRKRCAILLRDELPERIKARGLSTSRSPLGAEDIRTSMMYEDDEFTRLEQYRAALGAIKELLFGKMMSMNGLRRRAEKLLETRAPRSSGLGETDPGGKKMEEKLKAIVEEHENIHATAGARRRGFATKVRD